MNVLVNILAAAALVTGTVAHAQAVDSSPKAGAPVAPAPGAKSSNIMERVVVTNQLVNGKKTWLPAEITLKAGRKYQLELVNTLSDPHGFRAVGVMKAPVVVGPKETKLVVVEPATPGKYKFDCQLHPAHVGGQIIVE